MDADSIRDNLTLRFTELGRTTFRGAITVNAVENILIIPTDKANAREYFAGKPGYRNFRQSGERYSYLYNFR